MWWFVLSLICCWQISATEIWKCPEISQQPTVECSCDMPHTLRCTGDRTALQIIGTTLRSLTTASVSLLDCTLQNVTSLSGSLLEGVALHGLVISSGEIREIHPKAFDSLTMPLQALGLPNNQLTVVPTKALQSLPELDRLDLSINRMKILDGTSFKGLNNLSFIDLSDNVLTKIAPDTFSNLPQLKILRLRGNRLTIPQIVRLEPLATVEDVDITGNVLIGPLSSRTFPRMESLKDLQLSHNALSSIKMGALQGLGNITSLSLQHNQIDVLEDHAFRYTTKLVTLDLAHNRIVAVSGASLAHLTQLILLDLRHNFLRALTADLIVPLKSLRELKLDDNEISIVASDALRDEIGIQHLTLSENPLNCDCSLTEFAIWLSNSSIPKTDKASAICTTPPSLENGILIEVPFDNLLCGEDEQENLMAPLATPYKTRINLRTFNYDGKTIRLQWNIQNEATSYTCDAIFVYEEEDQNEVLIESNPLRCNSTDFKNPRILNVTVPSSIPLQAEHRYRYCVVLFESSQTDDVSLMLGCSDVIPLVPNVRIRPAHNEYAMNSPKIIAIHANLSLDGDLFIHITVHPPMKCELNLAILDETVLLTQRRINCSEPKYVFVGLHDGPYRVCASIVDANKDVAKSRCATVFGGEQKSFTAIDLVFLTIFSLLSLVVIVMIWCVRKMLVKPKIQTHQCFLPPNDPEEQQQHRRYVKLQATTKL